MSPLQIPLYSFNNGTFMIVVFALVCLGLIIAILLFMNSGTNKKPDDFNDESENKPKDNLDN